MPGQQSLADIRPADVPTARESAETAVLPQNGRAPSGSRCVCGRAAEWAYAGRHLYCSECASAEAEGGL